MASDGHIHQLGAYVAVDLGPEEENVISHSEGGRVQY